jgi:hypothetical protein
MKGSNPPLCSVHAKVTIGGPPAANQNRRTHGFYIQTYTLPELRDLLHVTEEPGIQEEIAAARIALRRILAYLKSNPDLDPDDFRSIMTLVFTGAGTISRLARTQHLIGGGAQDTLLDAIAEAMDQLSDDLPIQL